MAFAATRSPLFEEIQVPVPPLESKRPEGGKPCVPGFLVPLQERHIPVPFFEKSVEALLYRPDQSIPGRFRHGSLLTSFCSPTVC
jgi:hypothetical protein